MSRFRIKFLKTVSNGYGTSVEICQRQFDIKAIDGSAAKEAAIQEFCAAEQIAEWLFRADRIEVGQADVPARPAAATNKISDEAPLPRAA